MVIDKNTVFGIMRQNPISSLSIDNQAEKGR
jgi:hypothetical protein